MPETSTLCSGELITDPTAAQSLYARCPEAKATPLLSATALGDWLFGADIWIKDERDRMGLGSFKALGAAHAIAKQAQIRMSADPSCSAGEALKGETFVCASAGNHGLSLAAGARAFGADAFVYIAETVPESFAHRLAEKGATAVRAGAIYEDSMASAQKAADDNGWHFLPDSSWVGCWEPARDVMEGYLIMGEEVARQIDQPPTHVFLQAGVGGLAAAAAASARRNWGDEPIIVVVEPDAAPALHDSIYAGGFLAAKGPVSNMGRLDCKEPSHLALKYLAKEADFFLTISDETAQETTDKLTEIGLASTPSGTAGIAGAIAHAKALSIDNTSRILFYLSEEADV